MSGTTSDPVAPHIARIMQVMQAAFDPTYGEAWNVKQVTDALLMPSTRGLVVNPNGETIASDSPEATTMQPAGFILTRKAADEEELLLIAVSPQFRRQGLGEMLLQRLFERARKEGIQNIFLEMRRGNPAVYLYEKSGFKPIGERPAYYRLTNGERVDAITYGRKI